MGRDILLTAVSLILGGFIGLAIANCYHKRQMRASEQSQEKINTYFQRIERNMTEGFKMLWSAFYPGRTLSSEAKQNIEKASSTISTALLEPFYAAGTILAGDHIWVFPASQKSAAEQQDKGRDYKLPDDEDDGFSVAKPSK